MHEIGPIGIEGLFWIWFTIYKNQSNLKVATSAVSDIDRNDNGLSMSCRNVANQIFHKLISYSVFFSQTFDWIGVRFNGSSI